MKLEYVKNRFEVFHLYKRNVVKSQVPKVYWEYSSERVLAMEYCEGGKVDDREYMNKHNINVNEVSKI